MRQKIAISWLFPAAMILLLHTLVPHSHDFTIIQKAPITTCEHHHHGFWEFVEHLLEQNCGENQLEHYQTAFEKKVDFDNDNLLITNILPQFSIIENQLLTKNTISQTNLDFKNPFLLKNLTYRGPPLT